MGPVLARKQRSIWINKSAQLVFTLTNYMRSLHNLTIFVTQEKRVDFSEVNGVRALSFQQLISGGNRRPRFIGAMRRGQNYPIDKLLKRPAREPWN